MVTIILALCVNSFHPLQNEIGRLRPMSLERYNLFLLTLMTFAGNDYEITPTWSLLDACIKRPKKAKSNYSFYSEI